MNKKSIPLFIGVTFSVVVILLFNKFMIVDECHDQGGTFNYELGHCLLKSGDVYEISLSHYLTAFYFIIGIGLAFAISWLVKKFMNL